MSMDLSVEFGGYLKSKRIRCAFFSMLCTLAVFGLHEVPLPQFFKIYGSRDGGLLGCREFSGIYPLCSTSISQCFLKVKTQKLRSTFQVLSKEAEGCSEAENIIRWTGQLMSRLILSPTGANLHYVLHNQYCFRFFFVMWVSPGVLYCKVALLPSLSIFGRASTFFYLVSRLFFSSPSLRTYIP